MRKMLIVTEYFWPEDFIINDLASHLASIGIGVTVLSHQPSYPKGRCFTGRKNRIFSREDWNGVHIWRFKTVLGYKDCLFLKLLHYLWFSIAGSVCVLFSLPRFDTVFVYQIGSLTQAIPAIVAAQSRRKPLVIWTQDVWPDSVYAYGFRRRGLLPLILDGFVRWVYGACDTILVSCEGFRRIVSKYTDKELMYIPNWPLIPYVNAGESKSVDSSPLFVFAGNLGKLQNLENVIRGFGAALRKDPDIGRLRIIGDGSSLNELKEFTRIEAIPVEFPGRIHPDAMGVEYDRADFLILSLANKPVLNLTVPSKFQMYLSVGKPILCVARGEVATMVSEDNLGLTIDPDDPEKIGGAFLRMGKASVAERSEWMMNMMEKLQSEFDRKRILEKIRQVLSVSTDHHCEPEVWSI